MPAHSNSRWQQALAVWGSLVVIVASLYFARAVMIPVVLAVLLTFILSPLASGLQRRGLGRVPSVLLTVLIVSCLLAGAVWAVTLQVQQLAVELPKHRDAILEKVARLHGEKSGITQQLIQLFKDVTVELEKTESPAPTDPETAPMPVVVEESPKLFNIGWFHVVVGPLLETLAFVGLEMVLVIFMLIRREDLRNRLIRLAGLQWLTSTTRALDDAAQRVSRYLVLQLVVNITFAILVSIGLFFTGLPYPLLWGLIAGLLRFIPYVGILFGTGITVLFAITVFPGWSEPGFTLATFFILELLTANVVEPWLFGHGTGVSALALLLSAAFWTWLWGPIGLILSTPLTVCLAVLGEHLPQLEFFSILLGDDQSLDTKVSYYQRLLANDQDEAADLVEEYLQDGSPEKVYDEVFVPALVLAKNDRERGELSVEDEQRVFGDTQQILDELPAQTAKEPTPDEDSHKSATTNGTAAAERSKVVVAGCPAHGTADELALQMFQRLAEPLGCHLELLSHETLAAEVISWIEEHQPALLLVASLPPGGSAQTRYLCKRIRLHFPELKILVGRWGTTKEAERARQRLIAAGADQVGSTLLETRDQLAPLIQVLAHQPQAELAHQV